MICLLILVSDQRLIRALRFSAQDQNAKCPMEKTKLQFLHLQSDIQNGMSDTDILWLCTAAVKT